eukprot:11161422-Lingulodinium_polyedra.AAC.1
MDLLRNGACPGHNTQMADTLKQNGPAVATKRQQLPISSKCPNPQGQTWWPTLPNWRPLRPATTP